MVVLLQILMARCCVVYDRDMFTHICALIFHKLFGCLVQSFARQIMTKHRGAPQPTVYAHIRVT